MNITELENFSLQDAVKFNDELNPNLWDEHEQLKPEIREKLLQIAEDFQEYLGVDDLDLKDITLSGSNAAYTYTPHSDIDLHLVVDMPSDASADVYKELFDSKKYAYNDQHHINIKGYPVELYVQDSNENHISQGVYSVLNDSWVDVPKRKSLDGDDANVKNKVERFEHLINDAIESDDYETIAAVQKQLKRLRQSGLEQAGEFSPENLAFKVLRTNGLIDKLVQARNTAKDRELSLAERNKPKQTRVYGFKSPEVIQTEDVTNTWDGVADSTQQFLNEKDNEDTKQAVIDFIKFCRDQLQIERMPKVKLKRDSAWSSENKTFGHYNPNTVELVVNLVGRHPMDIMRTVAHELVHHRQYETVDMPADAGADGSEYENEANAMAGVLMRLYAKRHPELFQMTALNEASGYIPTAAEANDPRFLMALSCDVHPGTLGKVANAFDLNTDSQGHPQLLNPNGTYKTLHEEWDRYQLNEDVTNTWDGVADSTQQFLNEKDEEVPEWLIDLYDAMIRAEHQGGRGASPIDKRNATMSNKRFLKGVAKWLGMDNKSHEFSNALLQLGGKIPMAHQAKHGYDSTDEYLDEAISKTNEYGTALSAIKEAIKATVKDVQQAFPRVYYSQASDLTNQIQPILERHVESALQDAFGEKVKIEPDPQNDGHYNPNDQTLYLSSRLTRMLSDKLRKLLLDWSDEPTKHDEHGPYEDIASIQDYDEVAEQLWNVSPLSIKHIIETFIHEMVHFEQHLRQGRGTNARNKPILPFQYRSYLQKNRQEFYKSVEQMATDDDWRAYLGSPQEITAHAHDLANRLIQGAMFNKQIDDIPRDEIPFTIKALKNSLADATNYQQHQSYKNYGRVMDPDNKAHQQVMKRFLKVVYQEVATAINQLQTKYNESEAVTEAQSVSQLAPPIKLWKARVRLKQPTYFGWVDATVTAPDMKTARNMLRTLYGAQEHEVGSVTLVKGK